LFYSQVRAACKAKLLLYFRTQRYAPAQKSLRILRDNDGRLRIILIKQTGFIGYIITILTYGVFFLRVAFQT